MRPLPYSCVAPPFACPPMRMSNPVRLPVSPPPSRPTPAKRWCGHVLPEQDRSTSPKRLHYTVLISRHLATMPSSGRSVSASPLLDALTDDNVESSSPAAGISSRWGCTRRACVSVLLADLSVAHDQPGKETDIRMHTKCRNYHIAWCKIEDRATGLRPEPGDTLRTPVPPLVAFARV
jgi:hypothetical protein